MKPYGNKRKDNQTCEFGCCGTGKCHKNTTHCNVHPAFKRSAKKRARCEGKHATEDNEP